MFRKLLIANRGEVAVRIARAARDAGVSPVGVVSTADRGAAWTEIFDETVCIGGPAPKDSYLRMDAVVQAARQTGCAAIHPGWGFLAESAAALRHCVEQFGVSFVGPTAGDDATSMGLKSPAKVSAARRRGL